MTPKTLIAIVSCRRYRDRAQACIDTWATSLIDRGWDVQLFDGERLGVPDDYESLPVKVQALCRWARDNDYDHLLKIDDDSYVIVDGFKLNPADYAGRIRPPNNSGILDNKDHPLVPRCTTDYAQGGAYWLSRAAFSIIADAELDGDWAEDRMWGRVLANAGIPLLGDPTIQIISDFNSRTTIVTQASLDIRDLHKCFTDPTCYEAKVGLFFSDFNVFIGDTVAASGGVFIVHRDDVPVKILTHPNIGVFCGMGLMRPADRPLGQCEIVFGRRACNNRAYRVAEVGMGGVFRSTPICRECDDDCREITTFSPEKQKYHVRKSFYLCDFASVLGDDLVWDGTELEVVRSGKTVFSLPQDEAGMERLLKIGVIHCGPFPKLRTPEEIQLIRTLRFFAEFPGA